MKAVSLVALMAFFLPVPAFAADAAQIDCVIQSLSKPTQNDIGNWAFKLMNGNTPKPVSEKSEADIARAAAACQAKFGWKNETRRLAAEFARYELSKRTAIQYLDEHQMPSAIVLEAAMSLSFDERRSIASDTSKASNALLRALLQRGLPTDDKLLMRMAMTAGAMMLMTDTLRGRFTTG